LAPAGSNTTFYSNPKFDQALTEGNRAHDINDANKAYQHAEDILVEDLPGTPIFYGMDQTVWSKRVSGVHYDIRNDVVLEDVIVDGKAV
jgi:ABC-type transport system substrate-binding protein